MMSKRTDDAARSLAISVAHMRSAGATNKEIARIQAIDVKRVPALAKLGETLMTLTEREES